MDTPITRAEHEEFRRTVEARFDAADAEAHRASRRLDKVEALADQISSLTLAIKEQSDNIASMCKVQEEQGRSIKALESRDGEKWRGALKTIGTALAGALVGALFAWLGLA